MRILVLTLFLLGCASGARQSRDVLARNPSDFARAQVNTVPFVEQAVGHCGPAALTMSLRVLGYDLTVEQIAPMLMTTAQGTLPIDLLGASRRLGVMAISLENFEGVLREVAQGHPVIVFQNLGLKALPRWHFAVVTGFDRDRQEVILHSGPDQYLREPWSRFERSWALADYWAVVVLRPNQLAKSADELAHMKAAAGLEQAGRSQEAELAYGRILESWPASLGALIGLGNLAYQQKKVLRAVDYLKRAVKEHPSSVIARHNLEVAEQAAKTNSF